MTQNPNAINVELMPTEEKLDKMIDQATQPIEPQKAQTEEAPEPVDGEHIYTQKDELEQDATGAVLEQINIEEASQQSVSEPAIQTGATAVQEGSATDLPTDNHVEQNTMPEPSVKIKGEAKPAKAAKIVDKLVEETKGEGIEKEKKLAKKAKRSKDSKGKNEPATAATKAVGILKEDKKTKRVPTTLPSNKEGEQTNKIAKRERKRIQVLLKTKLKTLRKIEKAIKGELKELKKTKAQNTKVKAKLKSKTSSTKKKQVEKKMNKLEKGKKRVRELQQLIQANKNLADAYKEEISQLKQAAV